MLRLSANVNVSGNVPVRFHLSVAHGSCVSSGFESFIETISPLESKLAMFQCKEVKKILELR